MKLLIVDDDPLARRRLATMLAAAKLPRSLVSASNWKLKR